MHPKVISDKTLEKILWIKVDGIQYYLKNNSEIYVQRYNIILKNCTTSGTNKIAHH